MMNLSCQPLLDRITHIASKAGFLTKYTQTKSLQDKIKLCIGNEELVYKDCLNFNIQKEVLTLLSVLYKECEKNKKSHQLAEEFKAKGSKAYVRKKDEEAFHYYSEALKHSPIDAILVPILYANRSAVWFQLKQFKECLEDIERAEENGYPLSPQFKKLMERKFSCLRHLGLKEEAAATLLKLKNTEESWSTNSSDQSFLTSLETQLENISPNQISDEVETPEPQLFMDESKNIINMTSSFDYRYNEKDGRHIKAIKDVPKGSVVFKEKPFACILLPEFFLSHCQRCLIYVINPIYCNNCTNIVWCSQSCKSTGDEFHRYECNILHIITGVGIAHLALRIVLIAGWDTCVKVRDDFNPVEKEHKSAFKSQDKETRYRAVYSLLTHLDKAVAEDQLQYAIAAIILAKSLLDKSDFFKDQVLGSETKGCIKTEDEALIALAGILMHHIAQLVSNAHAITQVENAEDRGKCESTVCSIVQNRIASAIYPSASLMNHSCLPSIINSFAKDELIIHTIRDINRGDQVYNCYGPHANREERSERQSTLYRQYFFRCKCDPCTQDSFLIREMSWSGLICEKCNGVASWTEGTDLNESGLMSCFECKKVTVPSQSVLQRCSNVNQLFEEGEEAFEKGDFELAERKLSDALDVGQKTYTKTNHFLNTVRDTLAKTLASRGMYDQAVNLLSNCMETVSSRYGPESIEMAHELLKYSDLLEFLEDNQSKKKELPSVKRRIEDIFKVHYGLYWKKYLKMDRN